MPFLIELRTHLGSVAARFRQRRAFGDVLDTEVALDITADAAAEQGRAARLAYTAQQADLQAQQLLDQVLADGRVDADELPLLRTASRHVTRSADTDARICQQLTPA